MRPLIPKAVPMASTTATRTITTAIITIMAMTTIMAIITTITTMTTNMITDTGALSRLLAWSSPAYPVGAYTYSHGLETAVEEGAVRDVAALAAYVRTA